MRSAFETSSLDDVEMLLVSVSSKLIGIVGDSVMELVMELVGDMVGELVGEPVGELVGEPVGEKVNIKSRST